MSKQPLPPMDAPLQASPKMQFSYEPAELASALDEAKMLAMHGWGMKTVSREEFDAKSRLPGATVVQCNVVRVPGDHFIYVYVGKP